MSATPTVFIAAAGDSKRFPGYIKQLLPVYGEPIIHRTIRLVHEIDPDIPIYIITWKKELMFNDAIIINTVKPTSCLTDTILFSEPYWSQTNVFLLGDVVYYPESLKRIINSRCLKIFGTTQNNGKPYSERFALTFQKCDHDTMMEKCVECEDYLDTDIGGLTRLSIAFKHPLTRRFVYLNLGCLQPVKSFLGNRVFKSFWWKTSLFEEIGDMTDDIDTPKEYEKYIRTN
jgi:choline kinase